MTTRTLSLIVAVLAAALASAGCEISKTCTLIGCVDQFHVKVANANGSYTPGTHVLEVTADGVLLSCTFPLPPETVTGGATVSPTCSTGLQVFARPLSDCTTTTSSSSCTPIDGTLQEDITLIGTPTTVRFRQTVDGVVVFDHTETPTYQSSQPNGPGCDPICRQSSTEWTFATQ